MNKFWSELVKDLDPYVPGEQPQDKKYIKLNTNENPYPPSPKVLEGIKNATDDRLRLYPDPEFVELRKTVANFYGIKPEQVYAGNGSDEVLAFSFLAFFKGKAPILYPDITYSFYPVYCKVFGIEFKNFKLDKDFSIPLQALKASETVENCGGIIFANPNAPTGKTLTLAEIEEILINNKETLVIIDEAYIDFGGESAVSLIDQYENLLVIQTLSKSRALAGMRIGLIMGNCELIKAYIMVKNSINSYPLNKLSMVAAIEAFNDVEYFNTQNEKIIATREWTIEELKKLGFDTLPSKANLIFTTHKDKKAVDIFNFLRENGVLVRYFNKERIDNFLRISIGTEEEMQEMIRILKLHLN